MFAACPVSRRRSAPTVVDMTGTAPRWTLHEVRDQFRPSTTAELERLASEEGWREWRQRFGIPLGTPFLLAPDMSYDVELNEFFYSTDMLGSRPLTRLGYARDLKGFFDFLSHSRNSTNWRDASSEDLRAYATWRRDDLKGPRVSPDTWNRAVSALDRFYKWAAREGHVAQSPLEQRAVRVGAWSRRGQRHAGTGTTAAAYSHAGRKSAVSWLPPRSYRLWRDVGIRGYAASGVADPTFRGRWADRNAAFADLMVNTGMRLTEQSALTTVEIPTFRDSRGHHRFWLPAPIAKGGSARWVYVPSHVLRALHGYIVIDRRECIERARERGVYDQAGYLYLDDNMRVGSGLDTDTSPRATLAKLAPDERRRLLVAGEQGWEPASLWIGENGQPLTTSTWKDMFAAANRRCQRQGIALAAHAHLLRHTFAVVELERLQRGHIRNLAKLNLAQRSHYSQVFGDPLDWIRQRLGHRSITTTQIYTHTLRDLEMETRLALVEDPWDDPRDENQVFADITGSA